MQKRWLGISLIMLWLLMGTAIVLAHSNSPPVRTSTADYPNQSQGGTYTLHGETLAQPVEERSIIRPALVRGGAYTLNTLKAAPRSYISHQPEHAATVTVTRTRSVNPGAFLYDQDSTDIVMSTYYGLSWAANSSDRAGFYLGRPADWDGQSPVEVHITFALGSSDAGAVNWRLRLNHYTPHSGEWLTNPAARDADQILVFASGPSSLRIYDQTFTLQPEDFADEPYWSMFFTRGDGTNGETFADNLYVMGVDVVYRATPGTSLIYLPIVLR